jgi:transcriptional regulator with XRE-family HTH domain
MKKFKLLRESSNYTQKHLAEMMKTTQQTIARWEAGKAEPNLSALRDLAMIFGTSVDDLLGKNPLSDKIASTSLHYFGQKSIRDGFWGHVGLLLRSQKQTKWFPITFDTANRTSSRLGNLEQENEWLCIPTLNNRMLAVNPARVRRLWLLDDNCDAPDDWEINDDEYSGKPLEFYRGLDIYFSDDDELGSSSSETYREIIADYVKEHALDEEKARRFLHATIIHMADGAQTSYWAEAEPLANIVFDIDDEDMSLMVRIDAFGGDFECFYPAASLAVIDMPLLDVMDAAKELGSGEA